MSNQYRYEPEQPKRKHHWNSSDAGFVAIDGTLVAKCPADVSSAEAESELNSGIAWFKGGGQDPDRIYVVWRGALFRAVRTRAGLSYHGFPEHRDELEVLPKHVRLAIFHRARELGQEEALRDWIARQPSRGDA